MAAGLAGCVTDDLNRRIQGLEKQVTALENRVESIEAAREEEKEARPQPIPAPCLKKEVLQDRIGGLLNRRADLLIKYTDQHPDIVELDRQIHLAQSQIRMLDTSATSCAGTSATQQP